MAPDAPTRSYCPFPGCDKSYSRFFHLVRDHYDIVHASPGSYDRKLLKEQSDAHSLAVEAQGSEMERTQRHRVPTAKAAENSAAASKSAGMDPASLPIVTPEWNDLPTDPAFFEEPKEIAKVDPIKKISSTTGEEIELFRLGNHLETQTKYHYTRAKGDKATGNFHKAYASPDYARFSDEDHPLCNIHDPKLDVRFTKDMLTAYHAGPNRTFKANTCAREGMFFYEAKILSCFEADQDVKARMALTTAISEGKPHKGTRLGAPRIGFARREAWSGTDVGASGYGYGITCWGSDNPNMITCCGKKQDIPGMPVIKENDVIGLMISLPSLEDHRRIVTAKTPEEQGTPKAAVVNVQGDKKKESRAASTTAGDKKKESRAASTTAGEVTQAEGSHRQTSTEPAEPVVTEEGGATEGTETGKNAKKNKKKKGQKKSKGKGKATSTDAPAGKKEGLEIPTEPYPTIMPLERAKTNPMNIVHERFPIRSKGNIYFESLQYLLRPEMKPGALINRNADNYLRGLAQGRPIPTQPLQYFDAPAFHDWPNMRGLPGSKIELWVNGKYCGIVAENIFGFLPPASVVDVDQKGRVLPPNMLSGEWDDGTLGYYPAVTLYSGAMVQMRFHDFWYGHDGRPGVRTFEDRYHEQKVCDLVDDIIDECGWHAEHKAAAGDSSRDSIVPPDDFVAQSRQFMAEWHDFLKNEKSNEK